MAKAVKTQPDLPAQANAITPAERKANRAEQLVFQHAVEQAIRKIQKGQRKIKHLQEISEEYQRYLDFIEELYDNGHIGEEEREQYIEKVEDKIELREELEEQYEELIEANQEILEGLTGERL